MPKADQNASGWIIGAVLVVTGVVAYLWWTAPEDSVLSETYTVM